MSNEVIQAPVTPILMDTRALGGFLLSLTPLSCDLMGWRGAGGNGAASTGVYFFFGGVLMIAGALGEVSQYSLRSWISY